MKKHLIRISIVGMLTALLVVRGICQTHPVHPGKPMPSPAGKQNAPELLGDATEALAFTVKSARADKDLDPTKPEAKPFYESLKKINAALEDAKKSLETKDNKFFSDLSAAKAGGEEMKVTFELTKSKDADTIKGIKQLSGAVTALQNNFSPLAEREAKGGELTDAEKADFEKLKASQKDLLKKIHALEALEKKDPALEVGLKELRAKAHAIEKSPATLKSYSDASSLTATISGLVAGYTYYIPPSQRSKWVTEEYYTKSLPSCYSDESYDWSETTNEVEVYDSYSNESSEESSSDVSSEESYLDDTSFDESDSDEEEVADESDSISEDDAEEDESDMDSEEDDAEESDDDSDMGEDDSSDDDSGSDDESGGDE